MPYSTEDLSEAWLESELLSPDMSGKLVRVFQRFRSVRDVRFQRQVKIYDCGIADIVAIGDGDDGRVAIVIEVKRFANEMAIGQVLRYMGALKARYPDIHVHGMIAAYTITIPAQIAAYAAGLGVVMYSNGRLRGGSSSDIRAALSEYSPVMGHCPFVQDALPHRECA